MKEKLVNYEIAKALSDMNVHCIPYDATLSVPEKDLPENTCLQLIAQPSMNDVCDWLREVKGLHVYVRCDIDDKHWEFIIQEPLRIACVASGFYDTHDSALLAGIASAINHLKTEKK